MSTPSAPPPRWHRRPSARPEEILTAAIEVFGEVGFARARLDEVARRAGISKGTLYLYFDSKEAIFRAMVRSRVISHVESGEALLERRDGSARLVLEQFIRVWWEAARQPEMAKIIRLVHSEIGNFPGLAQFFSDEVIARTRRLLKRIVDFGTAQGEFRNLSNDFPSWAVGSLVVHGALRQRFWAQYDPDAISDEQVVNGIVDLILRGIELTPGSASQEGAPC